MPEPFVVEYTLTEADLDAAVADAIPELKPIKVDVAAGMQLIGVAMLLGGVIWLGGAADVPPWLVLIAWVLLAIVVGALLLLPLAFVIQAAVKVLLARRRRWYEQQVRAASDRLLGTKIRWTFDEDGFRTKSNLTSREVAWSDVRRATLRRTHWMLDVGDERLFFPAASAPDEVIALLRRRVAKVIDDSNSEPAAAADPRLKAGEGS